MLHAKTLVVDGAWGIVGSANVDIRSFRLNFEIGALVSDPDFAALLEERFRRDLEESREVDDDRLRARGRVERMRNGAARLLSPIL
jgi:cardiolipin synthase